MVFGSKLLSKRLLKPMIVEINIIFNNNNIKYNNKDIKIHTRFN
jgi:hypothetical protein